MRRRNEKPLDLLLLAPWWVSAMLAVIAYVGLRFVLPEIAGDGPVAKGLVQGLSANAKWFAIPLGLMALCSAVWGIGNRRRLDRQTSLESLRAVPWKEFEYLVAEAFRRQGYAVDYSLDGGADGGVDVILRKDGRTSLVQCKRWRNKSVTVEIVREQFGILTAEKADEAIIVSTGFFTSEATAFARGKPIRLVDGPQLLELIRSVQSNSQPEKDDEATAPPPTAAMPECPKCGRPMVERIARKGPSTGKTFWGCPGFPACRGTRPVEPAA